MLYIESVKKNKNILNNFVTIFNFNFDDISNVIYSRMDIVVYI